jgi:hypothetical protein
MVHPISRELLEKFCIVRKIISNPCDDLPVLYPHLLPFVTTDFYTLEQWHQPHKNYSGSLWWSTERDLLHCFMLSHASGFACHEEKRGSFRTDFFLLVDFSFAPHTPWVDHNYSPFPRYHRHRRHSPSRDEAQFGHRWRRWKYLLQPPRSYHQIEHPYLSLFLLPYFVIFLYLISLLLYQRHDIAVFFIMQGPSYTGL